MTTDTFPKLATSTAYIDGHRVTINGIAKGSGTPNKDKVGKVTAKQVEEIARQKMPDLNAASVDAAVKSVRGTARSMGIDVVG